MIEIEIPGNFATLSATLFEAKDASKILIIASATGVKQGYYEKFARHVAENRISVITFDYNGIGRSLKKPIKSLDHNTASWGNHDLEQVINYVSVNYPESQRLLLGHSIGGQLAGLAPSSNKLDKIVLVAAQSGYWKYWKGFGKAKMWFNWYVLFPTLIGLFGYLPSKRFSGMEDLPKHVANQWRNWGKKRNYLMEDTSINEKYYDQIQTNITAISIDDDEFAPRKAAEWMAQQYVNADIKYLHLVPHEFETRKIGHFGIFKDRFQQSIWELLIKELV